MSDEPIPGRNLLLWKMVIIAHATILALLLLQPLMAPVEHPVSWTTTLLLLLPGLVVLPGLLAKRPNGIVWTALVSLLYLTVAITDLWSLSTLRWLNGGIALFSMMLFGLVWTYMREIRNARKQALR